MIDKTAKAYRYGILVVKMIILISVAVMIYFKITDHDNFWDYFEQDVYRLFSGSNLFWMTMVCILMPINWLLEASKWRILAHPVSRLRLFDAFKGVLLGLSIGFVTPHGVGEYIGRISPVQGRKKGRLIGSVWLGRAIQMSITVIFGLFGVWKLIQLSSGEIPTFWSWWFGLFFLAIILVVLLLSGSKIWGEKLSYYFSLVLSYKYSDYLWLFLASLFRYSVFSIQLLIILHVFGIHLDFGTLFGGISWMFLMKSVLPSFNFLSDLGIREWSMLSYFDLLNVSQPAVVAASLALWMVNIIIPVLVGTFYLIRMKIL